MTVKRVCLSCGRPNRLPEERLMTGPKCGNCGAALVPVGPVDLTPAILAKAVRVDDLPLVVDFWDEWCGPCRMMAPEFDSAARQLRGRARFGRLDTEAHPEAATQYEVRGIPLLVLFRGGREAKRLAGARPAQAITAWVTEAVGA